MYVRDIKLDYSVRSMELHTETTLQVSYSIFRQPWPLVFPQTTYLTNLFILFCSPAHRHIHLLM